MNRAVFLDKDGTLIKDVPYNVDPARITLMPGAVEGLSALHDAGYRLIVVSNQSGVARGLFTETALVGVQSRVRELLADHGIPLVGFYYCPHHPAGTVPGYDTDCECRKPLPGMLKKAAAEFDIDLGRSWMIGDILNDVEAGNRAGCRTILLDNGHETEWETSPTREPDHVAEDLREAAEIILRGEVQSRQKNRRGALLNREGRFQ